VRFAGKLDFTIDASVVAAMGKNCGLLANVPAARLFDEFLKLFQAGSAERTFDLLRQHNLFAELFPADNAGKVALTPAYTYSQIADWAKENLDANLDVERISRMDVDQLHHELSMAFQDHFFPEIRRMERSLALQILDTAWKDHLLAMDHLRSSVGLRGYAQVDPKVEYKREGMRIYEAMWNSVDERVTDLVFRMEQLDEGFVSSTWVETAATHEAAKSASELAASDQEAFDGSEGSERLEPIRNKGERVGRNAPCPCGSGKKYKNCCLKSGD
jgi:preprotein translocase subunit SecA